MPASLQMLWKDRSIPRQFTTGVSLHGHTCHSWENLRWLSGYRSHWSVLPFVLGLATWQHWRATATKLDLRRTFWTPPLSAYEAGELEAGQIRALDLPALVSLTDHDNLESGLSLAGGLVSVEWTVPFGPTFFHLGLHNLPRARSEEMAAQLFGYTAAPSPVRLNETLELASQFEDTLIVLNHPLWDEAGIGIGEHSDALQSLLSCCGRRIHAIELNGLRSWKENLLALELAAAWERPAVGGGDRHGLEPNALINLTRATTFAEFAAEVRREQRSHVLIMPQYRDPIRLRWVETVRDIFRPHSNVAGTLTRWTDRFHYDGEDGVRRPFSDLWQNDRPPLLEPLFAFLRASESAHLRLVLRHALADRADAIPA